MEPFSEKVIEKMEEVNRAVVNNGNLQLTKISNQVQVGFDHIKMLISY